MQGFYFVHTIVDAAPGATFTADVLCETGDLPINGGYVVFPDGSPPLPGIDPGGVQIWESRHFVPSPFQQGWHVGGRNTSPNAQDVLVRAVCADIGDVPLPDFN